jgi:hypothetical protein
METLETTANRYYKPSGAVPLVGTILMQLFGGVAALLLAALYALGTVYSPQMILNLIAVFVFGAGVGYAVNLGARIGKVRNPGFIMLLGTATGILAMYLAWVFYIYFFARRIAGLGFWIWSPEMIFTIMQGFAEEGIWSMKNWTPTGWVLWAFWIAEAVCVVLLSLAVAVANDTPYCDQCNIWTKKNKDVASFALAEPGPLKTQLEMEGYEILDALNGLPKDPADCLKATVHSCPNCEDTDYLTVSHSRIVVDGDGNQTTQETEIVKHLRIPRDLAEHLQALGTTPATPTPSEDAPAPEDDRTFERLLASGGR